MAYTPHRPVCVCVGGGGRPAPVCVCACAYRADFQRDLAVMLFQNVAPSGLVKHRAAEVFVVVVLGFLDALFCHNLPGKPGLQPYTALQHA